MVYNVLKTDILKNFSDTVSGVNVLLLLESFIGGNTTVKLSIAYLEHIWRGWIGEAHYTIQSITICRFYGGRFVVVCEISGILCNLRFHT